MVDTRAAINIPAAQTGDVRVDAAAGGNFYQQGLDGDQVVELLGRRLERHLERIAGSLTAFVAVAAVQTAVLLLVAILILTALLGSPQIAGL